MIRDSRRSRAVTLWGMALNIVLMALKVLVGLLVGSSALVADGFHSLSDLLSDVAVLLGIQIADKPADATHPFGHKRFTTLTSLFVGVLLLVVGAGFIRSAALSIIRHVHNFPGVAVLVVAAVSVVTKEYLFRITKKVSRETGSAALYANAWHHRSDSLSSVAVVFGGIAGLFGWGHGDQAATVVVGFMILVVAVKILYEGLIEISEHAADAQSVREIEGILSADPALSGWHKLRTRRVGGEVFVDVHILVDKDLTVSRGHEIADAVEASIKTGLDRPVNVLVHVDPDDLEES